MAKFNVGDKIKVKTSGKTGVIRIVYESGYWNMQDTEYAVEFDGGEGAITLVERVLESLNPEPRCECGVGSVKGNKHSYYCPLYGGE